MGVLGRKYGTFGWQTAWLRKASVGVWDRKCVLCGGEFPRVESCTSPSRLGGVAESTPIPTTNRLDGAFESTRRRRGVDSYTYNQSTRRSIRVDSKLQGLQPLGNKKRVTTL